MFFHHCRRSPPLDAFVDCFWSYEGGKAAHKQERVLPSGTVQIVISLRDELAAKGGEPMTARHIPPRYNSLSPYLTVSGADRLLDFLKTVFDAEVIDDVRDNGRITHAAVRIAEGVVELSDATEQWGPMPGAIHIYVPDVDATYCRALAAGAKSLFEPADMYYGERGAGVQDMCGNNWYLATFQKVLSPEEMERRKAEWQAKQKV
ncbi:VOC family protein [uncultured Ferrovibrio sp.]|jgi:Uncharacterized protein conserved in bacteria|uniref:VOC family protein n=1 Tax=uncultured Ferrovibrio sp. TaxID=1576913 RepID=UPI00260A77B6|nr:VOC family protein [uncultured Ferrovibrio sp.]